METGDRSRLLAEFRVMYFDTDASGVVHNIAYLRFIESARTLLALQLGMSFQEIARTNIHPVVVHTEIDYRKPALLGDIIVVGAQIAEVSGARFWIDFQVSRPADSRPLVTCRQALALIRMPEGRPVRLPAGFPNSFRLAS
jgi:YbgC/YbaW family acyl-CoA thioester hydrolase